MDRVQGGEGGERERGKPKGVREATGPRCAAVLRVSERQAAVNGGVEADAHPSELDLDERLVVVVIGNAVGSSGGRCRALAGEPGTAHDGVLGRADEDAYEDGRLGLVGGCRRRLGQEQRELLVRGRAGVGGPAGCRRGPSEGRWGRGGCRGPGGEAGSDEERVQGGRGRDERGVGRRRGRRLGGREGDEERLAMGERSGEEAGRGSASMAGTQDGGRPDDAPATPRAGAPGRRPSRRRRRRRRPRAGSPTWSASGRA